MKPRFLVTIKKEDKQLRLPEQLVKYIKQLRYEDKDTKLAFTVERFRRKRSDRQNAFYWGVVVKLASELRGYTPQEMHDVNKHHILGMDRIDADNLTTTKMNTLQFSEYVNEVIKWYAQWDLIIPDPYQVEYDEVNNNFKV